MLRKLASTGTFMQTDAHPDDEDNGLLAMLGHGQGMRTMLVTLTRGDGGQNEIGPETVQALGVLRTEELLAVHRFDGAEQYFTRALDFGYSFSVEESIEKWGHDEILGDLVRHIRTIRPDVIAGFLCGGTGGGLHHQASAQLTREAFRAAADPTKYPEQIKEGLRPWQAQARTSAPTRRRSRRQPPPRTPDLLTPDISGFDPALGRTYAELGLEARSMHKCQGTSQLLLLPGQSQNRTYRLQDIAWSDRQGVAPKDLFDGIDTSIAGPGAVRRAAAAGGARRSALQAIARSRRRRAARRLASSGPAAAVPALVARRSRRSTLTRVCAAPRLRRRIGSADDATRVRDRLPARAEGASVPGRARSSRPARGSRRWPTTAWSRRDRPSACRPTPRGQRRAAQRRRSAGFDGQTRRRAPATLRARRVTVQGDV